MNPFFPRFLRMCVAIALAGFVVPLFADAPKIADARVDPNDRSHLFVYFDNPAPAIAAVKDTRFWIVYETTKTLTKRLFVIEVDASDLKKKDSQKRVDLFLDEKIAGKDDDIKSVRITLVNSTDFVQPDPLTTPDQLGTGIVGGSTQPFTGASSKTDADIYFNGSHTTVLGGDPVYSIDAFAGYMHAIKEDHASAGKLGLYGQVTTKSGPKADPNSFLTYVVYQNVLGYKWFGWFQPPIFNDRAFGAEFDRSARELNLITSPMITLPVRLGTPPENLSAKITSWPQLNLTLGTEFVDVRKSALAPIHNWHTRGLLGANFVTGYGPKKPGFDSWSITSSWQLRLPSAPEIFYDDKFAPIDPSTGKKNPKNTPPMLGTQPRHYFDTKFTYNYAAWGGVTFEHTYGSLPPAFVKTDQSFAFGLSFTLQQNSYGRYSILKP